MPCCVQQFVSVAARHAPRDSVARIATPSLALASLADGRIRKHATIRAQHVIKVHACRVLVIEPHMRVVNEHLHCRSLYLLIALLF